MNPFLLFWVPAALRLSLVLVGVGLVWFFLGPLPALAIGLLALGAMLAAQLQYLYRLNGWLDNPEAAAAGRLGRLDRHLRQDVQAAARR